MSSLTILAWLTLLLAAAYLVTILLFLIGLRRPASPGFTGLPVVTVVVAARNEEKHIGSLLDDLTRQDYPDHLYEIIIADDGSSDRTAGIVRERMAGSPFIRLLSIEECPAGFSPKKYALQRAVSQARGEIILATDADCRLGPQWASTMVKYFLPEVGFVIGFSQYGRRGEKQNLIERLQAMDFIPLMGVAEGSCNLGLPLSASGQNLAYRREAFHAVGGYSRVAHRVSGDDVLLLQLIRSHTDYRVVFASHPGAFASSAPQPTLADLINQRKRWASNGSFQLFLNIPFFAYLIMVYLYTAALFVGVPLSLLLGTHAGLFALCLASKIGGEWAISLVSAHRYGRTDLLRWFPLWFIVQIPYIVWVGMLGSFGNFKWKDRKHGAAL
ncbi:MAG TPA: glycosyltransferase [bacterium]|nr:glycosyltransferase [bacterium]HOC25024.1 glycosyltransferase [bacterium]HOH06841.1 glycosyltransferase [bacterium]HOY43588.1 glycosyltransferase [bacterium]HPG81949.1 glycosyltransferase [bacterium]